MHLEKENDYKNCSKKEKSTPAKKSIPFFCPREKGLEAAIIRCSERSVILLKMNTLTDILEEYRQEIQLATFKSETEGAVLIREGSVRWGVSEKQL